MSAVLSECGRYRYTLTREWLGGEGTCLFVMLNPSTADAQQDDPTIRRCIGFAQRWGFQRLTVGNLYAFRATDPKQLWESDGPVGEFPWRGPAGFACNRNDAELHPLAGEADLVVAAWGANCGPIPHRPERVCDLFRQAEADVRCLGTTKVGRPRHPLYVRGDAEPIPFDPAGVGA